MPYRTVTVFNKRFPFTDVQASPFNADNTGVVGCSAALEQIKAYFANKGPIYFSEGTYLIDADLTIPVGMQPIIPKGTVLKIATGKTLTMPVPDAGLYQIFDCQGTGKVEFNTPGDLHPEWWGAVADNSTDSAAAINAAIVAAEVEGFAPGSSQVLDKSYGRNIILSGFYKISDQIRVTKPGISLIGKSISTSGLWYSGGSLTVDDYILYVGNSPEDSATRVRPFALKNLTIRCDDDSLEGETNPRGIYIYDVHDWQIENIRVFYTHQGFKSTSAWLGRITGCVFLHNYRSSYVDAASHNIKLSNVTFGRTMAAYSDGAISSHLTVRNCWSVSIDTCDFEFGNVASLQTCIQLLNSVRGVEVTNCYFESNDGYAVYLMDNDVVDTGIEGFSFTNNFVNQSGGKGIYIRIKTPTVAYHKGLVITGNYVNIDAGEYFIAHSTAGLQLVMDSWHGYNSLKQALGERAPGDTNGWNRINAERYNRQVTGNAGFSNPGPVYLQDATSVANVSSSVNNSVSTSPARIATATHPLLLMVSGCDASNTSISFVDLVLISGTGCTPTVVETNERNAPEVRTYTIDAGGSGDIFCEMAVGTYKISVVSLRGFPSNL